MTEASTIPEILARRAFRAPDANAFCTLGRKGGCTEVTWSALADRVAQFAGVLGALGMEAGDRVAILAPTSIEWEIAQLGSLAAGGCVAGIDPSYPDDLLAAALESVEPAVIIAESAMAFARIPAPNLAAARVLVALRGEGSGRIVSLASVASEPRRVAACGPRPDDFAIITFSSGTTGRPKPIIYTHAQVVTTVDAIVAAFPEIDEGAHLVCWLPLANLFQRIIDLCAIERGATSYVVEDPREVMSVLSAANPDLLIGVPRFFEKLHAGIRARVDRSPFGSRMSRWAFDAGAARARTTYRGGRCGPLSRARYALAEHMVLRKVRAVFGTRLKFFVSGSAPMPLWLLEWFEALGLPILEAYGVSENVVPVAINTVATRKLGTVGRPLPPNELKLGAENEVLIRGPGVFAGYLERGALVPAPLTADGFWPTGDCGSQDAEGYLYLSGRKTDLFKLSTGRWVVPGPVEERLRRIPGVDQAVLLGAGRKLTVAVIAVSPETWPHLARTSDASVALDRNVGRAFLREVESALTGVSDHERPAGLLVATSAFSVTGGEMTTNLKVRRKAVELKYQEGLNQLLDYVEQSSGPEPVVLCA